MRKRKTNLKLKLIVLPMFLTALAAATSLQTTTAQVPITESNFTEEEKVLGRQHGGEILNRCNIAVYLDSAQCKAWTEFFKQDCQKFIDIWDYCGALRENVPP
jgi:hypothetical protein